MLQKIRDNLQGPFALVIIAALALVFVAWGAYGFMDFGLGNQAYAAKVNGELVPLERAREAWQQQQAEIAQAYGGEIPEEQRVQLQKAVLDALIDQAMLDQRISELGYRVTDAELHRAIQALPAFQVDGKYDPTIAKARLAQIGLSPQAFELDMRQSIARQQLQRAIGISDFVAPKELERIVSLEDEQREIEFVLLRSADFAPAALDDAAVKAYFEANQSRFMTTESVKVAWSELRLDQLAARLQVAEQDLQKIYEENRDRYADPEKRRASHILVPSLEKAQELTKAAQSGGDFAALAKANSTDTASAENGGDLGFATRDTFVGPFADALFAMQPGEVRGPVQTQFGYHVIRLEEIQPGRTKTYEEARPELEAQFRTDQAAELFGEREEQIRSRLQLPGATLESVTSEFGLAAGEPAQFLRGSGGGSLGPSPELQEILFSDAVLNQGQLGGPVPLGEDRVVIVKVLEHQPPKPRELAEVRDQIAAALKREKGEEGAKAAAAAALAGLESGQSFATVEAGRKFEGPRFIARNDPSVPTEVRNHAFSVARPQAGKPVAGIVPVADGVAVVNVLRTKIDAPQLTPDALQQRAYGIQSRQATGDIQAYVLEARRNADVTLNPKAFD